MNTLIYIKSYRLEKAKVIEKFASGALQKPPVQYISWLAISAPYARYVSVAHTDNTAAHDIPTQKWTTNALIGRRFKIC